MNWLKCTFQLLLLTSFSMWFGGFFFYVSFVVPIGTEVLDSAFDQGMITRRVTIPLNYLCGIAGLLMFIHSIISWRHEETPQKQIQLTVVILILGLLGWLFILHPQIDAYIDSNNGIMRGDYDEFYLVHRLYLWASTIQWLAGFIWICCYISSRTPRLDR